MLDFSDLIGKPYDQDGYGPDSYSCYGLAVEVFKRYGITIPRTNISVCACREASNIEIETHKQKYWEKTEELKPPLAIIIQSLHPGFPNHIGVFIGEGRMIHAGIKLNVVIDRIENWKHKIIGYYSYVHYTD